MEYYELESDKKSKNKESISKSSEKYLKFKRNQEQTN